MDLSAINRVYLIGIGGIGMSALARYFKSQGCSVAGYDRMESELTKALESEGIAVTYFDGIEGLIPEMRSLDEDLLVIRTPAVPSENEILQYFGTQHKLYKRSEVLGWITKQYNTIAIAGTHGKTTISCMVAHLLTASGYGCNAFLGGIATNYNSNVLINKGSGTVVVEADEYDRSFLRLEPNICAISSLDADHLDIYGQHDDMIEGFRLFAANLKEGGRSIVHTSVAEHIKGTYTYGVEDGAVFQAKNIHAVDGKFFFDLQGPLSNIEGLELAMPGRHNVENATAALAISLELGVEPQALKEALSSFSGVKRRFEYQLRSADLLFIDDYAHHPTEISACINAVREVHPGKKITAVFQPHLFSRTRDHADAFARSLERSDELILLDIYPAREQPIEGIDSAMLLAKVQMEKKTLCSKKELIEDLKERELEVLLTMGAGDIDQLLIPIKELFQQKIGS